MFMSLLLGTPHSIWSFNLRSSDIIQQTIKRGCTACSRKLWHVSTSAGANGLIIMNKLSREVQFMLITLSLDQRRQKIQIFTQGKEPEATLSFISSYFLLFYFLLIVWGKNHDNYCTSSWINLIWISCYRQQVTQSVVWQQVSEYWWLAGSQEPCKDTLCLMLPWLRATPCHVVHTAWLWIVILRKFWPKTCSFSMIKSKFHLHFGFRIIIVS